MAAFNRQITGMEIVTRVLKAIGLPVPATIAGSTDATTVQLWSLLTELGQELLDAHSWQFKTKSLEIVTSPGVTVYDIPEDFERFVDSTAWNNTARIPMAGPMTEQQWAMLIARNLGGTTYQLQYRLNQGKLELYHSPSEANTLSLTYISRGWVQDGEDPLIFKDWMEKDSDICQYTPRLIVSMLRFRWRRAKGFDTTDLEREYIMAFDYAANADTPGQDLHLSSDGAYPYLGYYNIPDTNYGLP
jgi:hypothetical protein